MLWIERHTAERRWWKKSFFWEVWILQVPYVRLLWHFFWHLLESQHGVSYTKSWLSIIWMPCNLSCCSFNLIWIFENHQSLSGESFWHMLSLFSSKVFFKHINLIILVNAFNGSLSHFFSCLSKTKGCVSIHFLHILLDFVWLCWIIIIWPSSDQMSHTLLWSWNSFGIDL